MTRFGFLQEDIKAFMAEFDEDKYAFDIQGIGTHLSTDDFEFSKKQWEQLKRVVEGMEIKPKELHVLNSINLLKRNIPDLKNFLTRHDIQGFCRVGAALYGLCDEKRIKTVMTIRTKVLSVLQRFKGNTIGYDRIGTLSQDSQIATISIGFAEGYPFVSNKGMMSINGVSVPVIGRVCMDATMLDCGHHPVKVGDEVVVWGKGALDLVESERLFGILISTLTTGVKPMESRVAYIYINED